MCNACTLSVYRYRQSNGRSTFFHVRDSRHHVTSRDTAGKLWGPSKGKPSKPKPRISPEPQVKKTTPEREESSDVPRSTQTHASPLVTAVVRSSLPQQLQALPGAAFMPDQSQGSGFSVGKRYSEPLATTSQTVYLLQRPGDKPASPVLIKRDGTLSTIAGVLQTRGSSVFSKNSSGLHENGAVTNLCNEQSIQLPEQQVFSDVEGAQKADTIARGAFSDEHQTAHEDKIRQNSARSLVVHLQNGSTVPASLRRKRTEEWTAHDCACVLAMNGFVEEGDLFVEHKMDGVALKLITTEQLHLFLGLKLSKALRLANFLENLLRMWDFQKDDVLVGDQNIEK